MILAIVARDFPFVGSDLRYYVPRLLDTRLHQQVNGAFAIQWYTPSFGGGLPAFPNPQHLQHSVLQGLILVVNPWWAYLIASAAALYAGFYAFAAVLQRHIGLGGEAATLGAVFYVGNGFFIEHLIIGHVGFQLLPLAAVTLAVFLDERRRVFTRACAVALVVSAMLYHAGIYSLFLSAFSLSLVLPVIAVIRPGGVHLRPLVLVVLTALPLTAAIVAPRVYSSLAFLRQFPREIDDVYAIGLLQAIAGLIAQLTGVMTLAPLFAAVGIEPERVFGALKRLIGSSDRFGIWELDVGLSPVAWGLLVAAVARGLTHVLRRGFPHLERRVWMAIAIAGVVTWVLVEATLARGVVYPLLKPLPILRSLHVNPRIAMVFVMPLAMIAATIAHRRYGDTGSRPAMIGLLLLALAAPAANFLIPAMVQGRTFDVTLSLDTYQRIRAGDSFTVQEIVDADDAEALAKGASSYRPYEPLFGYDLAEFRAETQPGAVAVVRDGAFNMTNPASLVFADVNHLRPFERIAAGDRENFDRLRQRRQPQWTIPALQPSLNWISLTALIAAISGVLIAAPTGRR